MATFLKIIHKLWLRLFLPTFRKIGNLSKTLGTALIDHNFQAVDQAALSTYEMVKIRF